MDLSVPGRRASSRKALRYAHVGQHHTSMAVCSKTVPWPSAAHLRPLHSLVTSVLHCKAVSTDAGVAGSTAELGNSRRNFF